MNPITINIPGDKSISHRAVILGALAEGETEVHNLLLSEDVKSTVAAFQEMGVVAHIKNNVAFIQGCGLQGLQAPQRVLDCGNSGTTMRLLMGLLAAQPFESELTGDASLNRRPMGRVMEPLRLMGAGFQEIHKNQSRIIKVLGKKLKGIHYKSPIASAQVKSALMLAGLYAEGETVIVEPVASRDHSERLFRLFGLSVASEGLVIRVCPASSFAGRRLLVPGDFSSAAFFIVAALIQKNTKTEVLLKNVGINPLRTGLLTTLSEMGGLVEIQDPREISGEPVGDLLVRPSSLKGLVVPAARIPSMIDEIPILAVAAACAKGKSVIQGLSELRVKESDRLAAIHNELSKLGVLVKIHGDDLHIEGADSLKGGALRSYGDHRMAMALSVAGTVTDKPVSIDEVDCVATSFPNFFSLLKTFDK